MKTKKLLFVLIMLACLFITSCSTANVSEDIWERATYTENKEFGDGLVTITAIVVAEDKTVEFTVNTDK